eukprot:COSAG02_NODE_1977_length_10205_cov_5.317633_2_plen_133_part_00
MYLAHDILCDGVFYDLITARKSHGVRLIGCAIAQRIHAEEILINATERRRTPHGAPHAAEMMSHYHSYAKPTVLCTANMQADKQGEHCMQHCRQCSRGERASALAWISVVQPTPESGIHEAEMPFANVTISG